MSYRHQHANKPEEETEINMTLMEKWRTFVKEKKKKPPSKLPTYMLQGLMVFHAPTELYVFMYYIIPYMFQDQWTICCSSMVLWFIVVNMVTNWLLVILQDPAYSKTRESNFLQVDQKDGIVQDKYSSNIQQATTLNAVNGQQTTFNAVNGQQTSTLNAANGQQTKTLNAVNGQQTKTLNAVNGQHTKTLNAVNGQQTTILNAVNGQQTKTLNAVNGQQTTILNAVNGQQATSPNAVNGHCVFDMGIKDPLPWHYCETCQIDAPFRSHHCNVCKKCILKMDHHCYIVGNCIGFNNQRYFVVFTFYIMTNCLLAAYFTISYIKDNIWVDLSSWTDLVLPLTIWRCFYGNISSFKCLLIFHLYTEVIFGLLGLLYFVLQMILCTSGNTLYEKAKGSVVRNTNTINRNLRSVFGDYWALNFLIPMTLVYKQRDDGIHWDGLKIDHRRCMKGKYQRRL